MLEPHLGLCPGLVAASAAPATRESDAQRLKPLAGDTWASGQAFGPVPGGQSGAPGAAKVGRVDYGLTSRDACSFLGRVQETADSMQTRRQRNKELREGALIVRRAISMGIVPDFKYGITLRQQTPKTQWALHILTPNLTR